MVETVKSDHYDLDLEDSKPILRDSLSHDDASPYQGW